MEKIDFNNLLNNYLSECPLETNLGGNWIYKGKTDDFFGSMGGGWEPSEAQGYLIERGNEYKFILRFPSLEELYIVIESYTYGGQLINYRINDNLFQKEGAKIRLIETKSHTISVKIRNEVYVETAKKLGLWSDTVLTFDENEFDSQKILFSILEWGTKIETIKKAIKASKTIIDDSLIENVSEKPSQKNTILYGPPGTGKTFKTIDLAVKIAAPENHSADHTKNKEIFDMLVQEGRVVFTTFHQSMCYEDFVEGIKPQKAEEGDESIRYEIEPGIFKLICNIAQTPNLTNFNTAYDRFKKDLAEKGMIELNTPRNSSFSVSLNRNDNLTLHTGPDKIKQGVLTKENIQKQINGEEKFIGWEGYFQGVINYLEKHYNYSIKERKSGQKFVLIIDEINRGNIAQIFGELITLLEEDKRQGEKEAIKVTLPYSKQEFGVPNNLFIIGTMNTADRSVEALDSALRRRFCFTEMMPLYDLPQLSKSFFGVSLSHLLQIINDRIEKLVDRDHLIGHSYFLNVVTESDLIMIFRDKIIPLLQEYFYGNYEKMGLVLGTGFVDKIANSKVLFAEFPSEDFDYNEKIIYRLNSTPFENEDNFKSAIDKLLNN